jgi:phosphatidylglycerophosphatase A
MIFTPLPKGVSMGQPAVVLATWFGAGLLPKVPGTWGSLAALPFAWAILWWAGPYGLLFAGVAAFGIGIWAGGVYAERTAAEDPGAVVIDEVAGQWLTLVPAALDPLQFFVGFILFRIMDILKPWPARWADRELPGGLGIMVDDIVAAAYAALALAIIKFFLL